MLGLDMRQIGTINNESQARIFGQCLYTKGITNEVEAEGPAIWSLWVHDEDRVPEAKELLERYLQNPTAPEWKESAKKASVLRQQEEASRKSFQQRFRDSSELFPRAAPYGAGLLTLFLIAICGYLAVQTNLGKAMPVTGFLMISKSISSSFLQEVIAGDVWRLLTPIFLHLSPIHLIANMLWLFQFGSLIEDRKGSAFLLSLVVALGVVSNLAQYAVHGPYFGGMSGVVYGLFGYLWMRGKFNPASGMVQDETTILLMVLWFIVCFTGMVGPIANTAHASGLLMGMAWGYTSAKLKR